MTRSIAIAAALAIVALNGTTTTATLLTEGGSASETAATATEEPESDNNGSDEGKDVSPRPSKLVKAKQQRNKQKLALLWGDDDLSPFPFPLGPKKTKAARKIRNFWSFFWGNHREENALEEILDDGFREDRERIRETVKKFYRLADQKFAKASLSSFNEKKLIDGVVPLPDGNNEDSKSEGDEIDGDELLPGTVLTVYPSDGEGESPDPNDEIEKPGLLEEYAYELVERMQLELGATPNHYMDFAYKSVTASSSPWPSSSDKDGSRGRGDSYIDDLLIDGAFDGISSGGEQSTCNVVIPTKNPSAQRLFAQKIEDGDGTDCNKDTSDRTLAFFASWWSFWLPYASSQWWKNGGSSKTDYDIGASPFAGGSNGEVWRGRRICHRSFKEPPSNIDNDCDDQTPLVLKRLRVERGYELLEAGLREVYFGKLIARVLEDTKQDMYTVYVDHFFREVPRRQPSTRAFGGIPNTNHHQHRATDLELWIVYEDAGPSLRSYIYSPIVSEGGFVIHQHSKLWTKLRTFADEEEATTSDASHSSNDDWESSVEVRITDDDEPPRPPSKPSSEKRNQERKYGRLFLQKTLRMILAAAAELHKRGIVHRDIKPSNLMCRSEQGLSLEELFEPDRPLPNIVCRLGDFSSGWDRYTSEHLYTKGPSPEQQTDEYAPPESYVGPYWKPFDEEKPQSYDSWSIGVLILELLLGTPNVFSVDQRTSALLTHKLQRARASEDEIAYALYLAALSNFCIFVPSNDTSEEEYWPLGYGDPLHKTAMVKESCTLQDFHRALRARDPLGIGFDSSMDLLLHLIWQLLAFDPSNRMTAEEALLHPYFISPDGTLDSLHQMPGYHNTLMSEMVSEVLDARTDALNVEDEIKTFQCPTCGRMFHDWKSCHQHANLRKHAKFCAYNHTVLPSCINTHSMLPEHPTSGYCDLQGRRKTIEDFHSIHLHHEHQFYGIFDGHTGNLASKFAASELYTELLDQLPDLMEVGGRKPLDQNMPVGTEEDTYAWKEEIRINVTKAFENVHERFLDRIKTMTIPITEVGSAPKMDQSGTTATSLLVTNDIVIAAVLGDSRGVLASTKSNGSKSGRGNKKSKWKDFPDVSAIPFSIDHVASDPTERDLVLQRGGYVSKTGGTARVNGTLAITRSIGDANLATVLSREPHVRVFDRSELQELCGDTSDVNANDKESYSSNTNNRTAIPCFAILASDGLWDVMSNQEAVDMVLDVILRHNEAQASSFQPGSTNLEVVSAINIDDDDDDGNGGPFQESAERLAVEAYVRGSTDNIGVCVVAID